MNLVELIEVIRSERDRWEATLEKIQRSRLSEPGVEGDWSVKDIIAHLSWFEREMVNLMQTRRLAGSEWWTLPTDLRNENIYLKNRDLSLDQVVSESQQVHRQLIEALQTLSDVDLSDPGQFADMPSDWQPLRIIAENTFEHYQDHRKVVEDWLG
jgi:uncharacterized damage-inducible protein DinB